MEITVIKAIMDIMVIKDHYGDIMDSSVIKVCSSCPVISEILIRI